MCKTRLHGIAILMTVLAITCVALGPAKADDMYLPQPAALEMTKDLLNGAPEEILAGNVQTLVVSDLAIGGAAQLIPKISKPAYIAIVLFDAWNAGSWYNNYLMYNVCKDPNINVVDFQTLFGVPYSATPIYYSDFTLLREMHRPEVYVMIGGAPLYVNTAAYFNWNWPNVHIVEDGRIQNMWKAPVSGTIVREWNAPEVYEMFGGYKCHIMSEGALYRANSLGWLAVHVVPDGSLSAIPSSYNIY